MNKYFTNIKVEINSSSIQKGDNANEIRLMTTKLVERAVMDAIENNKELKILFKDSKVKCSMYIERTDKVRKEKRKKRILSEGFLEERFVNLSD